ncbi:DUF6966 domain-containing protein [Rubritalea spongiae]|uniref:DUF6966 domain-containing protein n=1 Tax=Rubritalea spongiae TaxID=430797 RepID=A0ABW5E595_9BACT
MSVPITQEIRLGQLQLLIESLCELNKILALDTDCQWTAHFRRSQLEAEKLLSDFTQDHLNVLSTRIRSVYGGMGSFSDYVPITKSQDGGFMTIAGMENLTLHSGHVYDQALELKVVGRR